MSASSSASTGSLACRFCPKTSIGERRHRRHMTRCYKRDHECRYNLTTGQAIAAIALEMKGNMEGKWKGRRPPRHVDELNESERWQCATAGCTRTYARSSSASIRQHRIDCARRMLTVRPPLQSLFESFTSAYRQYNVTPLPFVAMVVTSGNNNYTRYRDITVLPSPMPLYYAASFAPVTPQVREPQENVNGVQSQSTPVPWAHSSQSVLSLLPDIRYQDARYHNADSAVPVQLSAPVPLGADEMQMRSQPASPFIAQSVMPSDAGLFDAGFISGRSSPMMSSWSSFSPRSENHFAGLVDI